MLLQRLKEYADLRMDLPPPLYSESPVRYVVELGVDGKLRSREPTDTADPSSPRTKRGTRRLVPLVNRAVAIVPLLLADNGEYTFSLAKTGRSDKQLSRVTGCHAAYMAQLRRCAQATEEPAVLAVLTFLSGDPIGQLALPDDFDSGSTVTFRVHVGLDAVFPIDLPAVQSFWAAEHDPEAAGAERMQCLVCGNEKPVLSRLQAKLKGVRGGQTSGTAIISANAEAFESYGLQASLIAPTCAECGERFTKAANELIAGETSHLFMGGTTFIFWTREPNPGFSFFDALSDPDPTEVAALLEAARTGRPPAPFDHTAFYAAALSGSGGRAVVRDWIDTTVGAAKAHLARWFAAQEIVDPYGEPGRPLGVSWLCAATLPRKNGRTDWDKLPPPVPRALLRSALTGTPPAPDLLFQAIRRNHAEQDVTYPRAALIKLALWSREPTLKERNLVALDPGHPSPAYHCGRLLAVLDEVQRAALPGVNATIIDRFFGTASTAPGSVFSRLVRGAQPHLGKLQRNRAGAYVALQGRLEEILGHIQNFPRTLTLEEQGLFALGYYHQRAQDRGEAHEAAERRRAANTSATTDSQED
jgi:CRISPR-associated protein Csd1